jgi:hypothetical protein
VRRRRAPDPTGPTSYRVKRVPGGSRAHAAGASQRSS